MREAESLVFGTKDAAYLAGLTFKQLDYLIKTGCINPTATMGRVRNGKERLFTFANMVALCAATRLSSLGINTSSLKEPLVSLQAQLQLATPPYNNLFFLTDAEKMHALVSSSQEILDIINESRGGFSRIIIVEIDEIVRSLKKSVHDMEVSETA